MKRIDANERMRDKWSVLNYTDYIGMHKWRYKVRGKGGEQNPVISIHVTWHRDATVFPLSRVNKGMCVYSFQVYLISIST